MYPGQAPNIRRILFNVMVVLDLSRPESLHFTANTISMLVDRSYPTRIDFAPIVETEDGVKMASLLFDAELQPSRDDQVLPFGA
jgi:UDP-glucose:glycoprotein glucosyltransferase